MDGTGSFIYNRNKKNNEEDLDGHDYAFHRHETKETQDYLTKAWYELEEDDIDDDDW